MFVNPSELKALGEPGIVSDCPYPRDEREALEYFKRSRFFSQESIQAKAGLRNYTLTESEREKHEGIDYSVRAVDIAPNGGVPVFVVREFRRRPKSNDETLCFYFIYRYIYKCPTLAALAHCVCRTALAHFGLAAQMLEDALIVDPECGVLWPGGEETAPAVREGAVAAHDLGLEDISKFTKKMCDKIQKIFKQS